MLPSSSVRVLSVLVLILGPLVCIQAQSQQPSLADLLSSSRRPASVSTASTNEDSYGYEAYGVETKEICLQEIEQKYCGGIPPSGGPTVPTAPTTESYWWTSEFSCCQEEHGYGYGPSPIGLRNNQLWGSQSAIGSCDWTITWNNPLAATGPITVTSNIDKIGTAWATCYFGPEAEQCGGPLCDRFVLTMQGTIYRADTAYSYWGTSNTQGTCGTTNFPRVALRTENETRDVDGAVVRRARASRQSTAELQYDSYGHGMEDRDVYSGEATIIMGVITAMAGQKKEKWDEGVFEYVAYFVPNPTTPITTGLAANIPWVRDKNYKLTFYKHSNKY